MKKRVYTGAAVLLLALVTAVLYSRAFPIQPDGGNLAEYASQHLNRGSSVPMENHIKLYDSVVIGKKKFTLMELNGDLGEIRLTCGLNGRYRIDFSSFGRICPQSTAAQQPAPEPPLFTRCSPAS